MQIIAYHKINVSEPLINDKRIHQEKPWGSEAP